MPSTRPHPARAAGRGPYSPAVRAGDLIVLAGQVGIDPDGKLVARDVEARPARCWQLAAVLGDCGAGWGDAPGSRSSSPTSGTSDVNALYKGAIGTHRPGRTHRRGRALPAGAAVEIECWVYAPYQSEARRSRSESEEREPT